METYKNILANKFMRDTNYIIIKDTDDLEELERQWELFNSQLTVRQQRLSDDRSIEIWNKTNKEHYEDLKIELMKNIDSKLIDSDNNDDISYDTEEEDIQDEEITNLINMNLDDFEIPDDENDITESIKEDSVIPIEDKDTKDSESKRYHSFLISNQDIQKDNMADQYEIDTNMHIVGRVTGKDVDDYLSNLEKSFVNFNAQTHDHRKKSDDKCREIYGMSNIERYNKLKANALNFKSVKTVEKVKSTDNKTLDSSQVQQLGEFVSQVYDNMQAVNEVEQLKVNKHRRFNDTPYFTPTELIDMGVHGNHNFYSKDADNDGLITNIKVATWFDSYKDMCMDHIFEDYRKDWIDTLDMLYSDFEDIKASGNEEKILARKQSILDLGWNPEIPFNRKNRLKASERVSKILDETIPRDIFINLNDIPEPEEDDIIEEQITKKTHQPVFLIFTQGKTPIISSGIKFVTHSEYSHASISFDPELNEVYSFNMGAPGENGSGFVRENLKYFKDNVISVMAFFAPNKVVNNLKEKINSFKDNKTTYDFGIILNKILHIDRRVSNNEYNQVCSTFVDSVLKSNGINLTGDIEIPDPGQLYNASKSAPNKIIEIFNDVATKYNGKSIKKKLNALYNKKYVSIEEACKDLKSAREFVSKVGELAKKYDANYFIVTDGASGIHNNGNPAVKNARDSQIKWEKEHGFDPDEDWSKKSIEEEVKNKHIRNVIHIKDRIDIEAQIASLSALVKITKDEKKKKELEKIIDMYRSMRSLTALEGSINEEATLPIGVTLRNATKDDTDNMFKWKMESVDKSIRNDPKTIKYIKDDVQKSIKDTKMIMYKNETVGMFTTCMLNGYWYIGEIYIVKEHRNKGIGTALLKDEISKHDKIKLKVAQSNHGAMKLYKSLGFEITDRNDEGILYIMTLDKKEKPIKENKDFVDRINEAYLSGIKDTADILQYHGIVTESTSILNETMELYLTKPEYIFKKNITLYHGTDKKIPNMVIDPKYGQLNIGTKLSNPRYSTWWVDDEFFAMSLGISAPFMKKYNISSEMAFYNFIMVDYENKIIYVNEKEKDTVKKILNETDRYMYVATVPTNIIGRGHNIEIEEYTIDVPIKADKEIKLTYDMLKPYIKIIPQEQFQSDEMIQKYTLNTNGRANKPNIIEKLIYKTRDDLYGPRKYNKFLNKLGTQNESVYILNEVKRFPIEFDKEGNLIIYKARTGSLAFGDEIDDSVQLLQAYRNASNIEGIKYELAKLWYINDCIEKKLKKRLSNEQYKELIDTRATCLNVFKTNLDYVMKAEKGFNFSDYYNSTPFSDNSTKITANTLKYAVKTVTNMI